MAANSIDKRDRSKPGCLSYQQHQLWFLNHLAPANVAYTCGYATTIRGPLNPAAFSHAIDSVLGRQELLRTRFLSDNGRPVPEVVTPWNGTLKQVDLRSTPFDERLDKANRLVKAHACLPYDLSHDLPIRTLLIRLAEEEFVFAYFPHHIVWELRSTPIFFNELKHAYESEVFGEPAELPELPIQYRDYAAWQREQLTGQKLETLQEYWRSRLAGAPPKLTIRTDRPHPPSQTYSGARFPITLPDSLRKTVDSFCEENGTSSFRVLCAAFQLMLSHYSGQHHISVGTPVIPVLPREIEPVIGLFAQTVVIDTKVESSLSFRQLAMHVSDTVTKAIRRALPFDLIVSAVQPPRDASRMVLFQSNFRVVKSPLSPLDIRGLDATPPEWVDTDTSKFDLSMELVADGGPGGFIEYRTDLFDHSTMASLADDYLALLSAVLSQPDLPIMNIEPASALTKRPKSLTMARRNRIPVSM